MRATGMSSWIAAGVLAGGCVIVDPRTAPAGEPAPAVIASGSLPNASGTYRDEGYSWLGEYEARVTIEVPPSAGHVLAFRWGAKNDTRTGALSLNGKEQSLSGGGYDGFRWLRVEVGDKVSGKRYELVLKPGRAGKPGFVSAIRLEGPAATSSADPAPVKIELVAVRGQAGKAGGKSGGEAFPEMRELWPEDPDSGWPADERLAKLFRRASANGRLMSEALYRSRRFVDGWLAHADPETELIPRNLGRDRGIWNAKDSAADNYPFMVLACALTDREMFDGRMLRMLRTETRVTSRVDRLPDTYSFAKRGFASGRVDLGSIMFGSSEYVKDGLLPLTEWLGRSPWSERMIGILDDMWKHAPVETPFGKIVSTNVEVNGEMLQALSRVYWMTGDEKYLNWAVRLGDYHLLGGHHPTRDFGTLKLRDHGCEILSGLCELYATVARARPAKRDAYRPHVHEMLDRVLEVGRNEHGLFYNSIDPRAGKPRGKGAADTWGYNLNGFYTVYLVDGTEAYRAATLKALGALADNYRNYRWEGSSHDGYADSIESALNLYNREPVASAADWIDSETRVMWRMQKSDGVIGGWHGDGNFARTSIMYAFWKSRGTTLEPWRADVRVGAVDEGGALHLTVAARDEWRGRLRFDRPRHRTIMRMPFDWPRINQFPEWFTVEEGKRYRVRDAVTGAEAVHTGAEMAGGLPLEVAAGGRKLLTVTPVK
ncbi:MAG: hypothetical protein ACYS9X_07360 [Planctomycetota bacterium]|jgi:hypothetical protein